MTDSAAKPDEPALDLNSVLTSRGYHALLLAAVVIGVPVALIAFGFLAAVDCVVLGDLPCDERGVARAAHAALRGHTGAPAHLAKPSLVASKLALALPRHRETSELVENFVHALGVLSVIAAHTAKPNSKPCVAASFNDRSTTGS